MRKELKTFEVERIFFLELLCLAPISYLTAATAAGTLARLFTEWLCYVLCSAQYWSWAAQNRTYY